MSHMRRRFASTSTFAGRAIPQNQNVGQSYAILRGDSFTYDFCLPLFQGIVGCIPGPTYPIMGNPQQKSLLGVHPIVPLTILENDPI